MSERNNRSDPWESEESDAANAPYAPLTREQAQALTAQTAKTHPVSPWRVIAVQAAVGLGAALLAGLAFGRMEMFWSVLYGAGVVVVPGALMARGMTSKLSSMSPGTSAVSFMLWEFLKIGVSVVLLALAPKLVPQLSWPALLVAVVVCMKVYWWALLWRR